MQRRVLLLVAPMIGVFLFMTAGAAGGVGRLSVSDATPTPGAAITVMSTGWSAGQEVTIALRDSNVELARVAADTKGTVRAAIIIPDDVVLDVNVLSATGRAASGVPQQIVTPVAVHGRGDAPARTRPWGVIIALSAIAGALVILSVMSPKPSARLAAH